MGAYAIEKPTTAPAVVILNPKSWTNPAVTFQNATGQDITITVTNYNVQETDTAVFNQPPAGALVIPDGALGVLETPHVAASISGGGTGFIYIVQSQ